MDWEKAKRRDLGRPAPKKPWTGAWRIIGRKWSRCSECREPVADQPAIYNPTDRSLLCMVCGDGVQAHESRGYQLELKRRASVDRLQREVKTTKAKRQKPNREPVRQVACPKCGAQVGKPCKSKRGTRKANHAERVRAWKGDRPPPVIRGDAAAINSDWLTNDEAQMVREAMAKRETSPPRRKRRIPLHFDPERRAKLPR